MIDILVLENLNSKKAGNNSRALKNLMFFKCGYPQSKKIVNEAEVFSFINYFYLVIYIITRIFLP